MSLGAVTLEHGETFGSLKVLRKLASGKYQVGCTCGFTKDAYRANALMRAGGWTKCSRCRKQERSATSSPEGEKHG